MNNAIDYLEQYGKIVGSQIIEQLIQLALPLRDKTIVHVNSTKSGGGVAEILSKMIPLSKALGLNVRWEVISGNEEFFKCTKSIHNALQGNKVVIPSSFLKTYEEVAHTNANNLRLLQEADIVFIHDPQPLPMIVHFPQRKGKWIWRCHIDAAKPYRPVWKYLSDFISPYDATIFSLADFTHPSAKPIFIVPPSIDPLSDKNMDLNEKEISDVMSTFGIDPTRPRLVQISRFDRFKDPLGVIEAYRYVKKFNPKVQLVLAGGGASDDPEGAVVYEEVLQASSGDPDIHVLLLPDGADRAVNALQRMSDIVLQKSVKEGFGLTVTEGLWKGKPVIGGNTGGIRLQVINWETGFLINTPEGAAYRIRYLLQNPEKITELGIKGRQFVREKYLITRHLRDYLSIMNLLLHGNVERIELQS